MAISKMAAGLGIGAIAVAATTFTVMKKGAPTKVVVDTTQQGQATREGHQTYTCGDTGVLRERAITAGRIPAFSNEWLTWMVPEYQDKQRFSNNNGPTRVYGPIACVVAAPKVDTLTNVHLSVPNGVVVAIAHVNGGMALSGTYTDLKLSVGYNCVILRRQNNQYRGHVVPVSGGQCAPITPQNQIQVDLDNPAGATPADHPAVARFVEKRNWKVAIGTRCPDGWCNLGLGTGPDAKQGYVHGGVGGGAGPAWVRRAVLGWHDQQRIALPAAATPIPLRSQVHASIVPDPALAEYTTEAHFQSKKLVAEVYLDSLTSDSTKYSTRWGFTRKGSTNPNKLELERNSGGVWTVYVNGFARPNLKVRYTRHTYQPVVATARWAWSDADEGIWVRCIMGCCEIEDQ